MNARLVADAAAALARRCLAIVAPCLREEELVEAYALFFEAGKEAIEDYHLAAERLGRRLSPTTHPGDRP